MKVLKGQLDDVMVRRLKSDVRALEGGFPKRTVVQIDVDGLPPDAPELVLAGKLHAYRLEREKRLAGESRSQQAAGALAVGGLQKRLLSSIEAFAKTLAVHRRGVLRALEEAREAGEVPAAMLADLEAITAGVDRDAAASEADDADPGDAADQNGPDTSRGHDPERELAERMEAATIASSGAGESGQRAALQRELALIEEMQDLADASRYAPDPRIRRIVAWIGDHLCPGLASGGSGAALSWPSSSSRSAPASGRSEPGAASPPRWNDRRVIVFTEYEDTRRYLERCLREAIAHTATGPANVSRSSPARPRHRSARTSSTPSTPSRKTIRSAS